MKKPAIRRASRANGRVGVVHEPPLHAFKEPAYPAYQPSALARHAFGAELEQLGHPRRNLIGVICSQNAPEVFVSPGCDDLMLVDDLAILRQPRYHQQRLVVIERRRDGARSRMADHRLALPHKLVEDILRIGGL